MLHTYGLLTEKEVSNIISINYYWEEVSRRTDQSPLQHELMQVVKLLDTKILWILADYAKSRKEAKDHD